MSYADYSTIRGSSELRLVQDADDATLDRWIRRAKLAIDQFCSRDFVFEEGVAKDFYVTSPLIVLDKEVSNITAATVTDVTSGAMEGDVDIASEFMVMPTTRRQIRFRRIATGPNNYPVRAKTVTITADWGTPEPPDAVVDVFLNLIERLAARSNEDDVLQGHSAYLREDDGDGYTFDRGNGTLRNLLRSEDRAQLWKHVAHGRVVG